VPRKRIKLSAENCIPSRFSRWHFNAKRIGNQSVKIPGKTEDSKNSCQVEMVPSGIQPSYDNSRARAGQAIAISRSGSSVSKVSIFLLPVSKSTAVAPL